MDKSQALVNLYDQVKSLTVQAGIIYDKIEYVKRHGELPKADTKQTPSFQLDYAQVKDKIRSINNITSKLRKNLKMAEAKSSSRGKVMEWNMRLEELTLEREVLYKRKKEMESGQ